MVNVSRIIENACYLERKRDKAVRFSPKISLFALVAPSQRFSRYLVIPNAMFGAEIFGSIANRLGAVTAFPILFVSNLPHSLPRNHVFAGGFVFFHLLSAQV